MLKEKQLNNDVVEFKTSVICTQNDAKERIGRVCSDNGIPVGCAGHCSGVPWGAPAGSGMVPRG